MTSQLSSSTFMFPNSFVLPPSASSLTSSNLFAQSCQFVNFPLSPSPILSQWSRLQSSLQSSKPHDPDDPVTTAEEIQAQINTGKMARVVTNEIRQHITTFFFGPRNHFHITSGSV
ncbi:hypothetical protein WDU94_015001 [Cyamophila willieti]